MTGGVVTGTICLEKMSQEVLMVTRLGVTGDWGSGDHPLDTELRG